MTTAILIIVAADFVLGVAIGHIRRNKSYDLLASKIAAELDDRLTLKEHNVTIHLDGEKIAETKLKADARR